MKTKSVFYIYGEPTVTVSFKVPESKRKEIMDDIRDNVLSRYENPKRVDIDVQKNNDIASMNPVKKEFAIPAEELSVNISPKKDFKFERIASLPLGTDHLKSYGSKGALRTLNDKEYYTKRTYGGKLEILKHKDYESALLYCESNFK